MDRIIPGIIRLVAFVGAGVFAGSLLASLGWLRGLSFLARPFQRMGGLPPQCSTAFAAAFVSPRMANGILAGAFDEKNISRPQMITGALANIFPNTLTHIRIMAFAIVPLTGYAGVAYVFFQLVMGLACSMTALLIGRFWAASSGTELWYDKWEENRMDFRQAARNAFKQMKKLLKRVCIITVPLYILVAYLDKMGVFSEMANGLPAALTDVLPPASIAVLVGHMTNIVTAASNASALLDTGTLDGAQVFLTFVVGYGLALPIRALRHNIPSAVGVFPGKDGLTIVMLGTALRFLFTLFTITGTIILIKGGFLS